MIEAHQPQKEFFVTGLSLTLIDIKSMIILNKIALGFLPEHLRATKEDPRHTPVRVRDPVSMVYR